MLLQTEHSRSLAFTSRTAAAKASASSSLERKMWNASRCALLLPIPGSFFNSSMSRAIGSANLDIRVIVELGNLEIVQLKGREYCADQFPTINYAITNFLQP